MRIITALSMLVGIAVLTGCERALPGAAKELGTAAESNSTSLKQPERLDARRLPNALRIHAKVISGGQPDGEAGFRELKEFGVKTIISVDGAKPDVELARKYGLKYVHLPHGYDGIPPERTRELAKAVRDLDAPIYIHCHHGKHRSPAAAAVACVSTGLIEPTAAIGVLKAAGTSENYRGLYQSAKSAQRLDDALLDALDVKFPETAKLPPLAEAMVALEHTHDHLKAIAAAGWKTPPSDPDLEPAHEALLLQEQFTELQRSEQVQRQPKAFQRLLRDAEAAGKNLEGGLRQWNEAGQKLPIPDTISASLARVTANCTACHRQFRDVPRAEKERQ